MRNGSSGYIWTAPVNTNMLGYDSLKNRSSWANVQVFLSRLFSMELYMDK